MSANNAKNNYFNSFYYLLLQSEEIDTYLLQCSNNNFSMFDKKVKQNKKNKINNQDLSIFNELYRLKDIWSIVLQFFSTKELLLNMSLLDKHTLHLIRSKFFLSFILHREWTTEELVQSFKVYDKTKIFYEGNKVNTKKKKKKNSASTTSQPIPFKVFESVYKNCKRLRKEALAFEYNKLMHIRRFMCQQINSRQFFPTSQMEKCFHDNIDIDQTKKEYKVGCKDCSIMFGLSCLPHEVFDEKDNSYNILNYTLY
ncbi:hypothetical protein ABK040_006831 [Willaertia magna]